jgi:hypothetical protein
MLNELNEAIRLLEGNFYEKEGIYRGCLILVKYYKYLGYSPLETRNSIKEWQDKYNITFDFEINPLIHKIYDEKMQLIDKVEIPIAREEVIEILSRFDRESVRFVAFLILCIGKFKGNKHGAFDLSIIGLSYWSKISYKQITRILDELKEFEFITQITKENVRYKTLTNKIKTFSKTNIYKLNIELSENVDFIISDEDIKIKYLDIVDKVQNNY